MLDLSVVIPIRNEAESLEERNNRHLQAFRFLEAKAVKALREKPIENAVDASRALELAVREQRVISGDPSDRTEISIDEKIKREYERWMIPAEPEPERKEGTTDDVEPDAGPEDDADDAE